MESLIDSLEWNDILDLDVRVNGRVKNKIMISRNLDEKMIRRFAEDSVREYLAGRTVSKYIYVPLKGINFVVKP